MDTMRAVLAASTPLQTPTHAQCQRSGWHVTRAVALIAGLSLSAVGVADNLAPSTASSTPMTWQDSADPSYQYGEADSHLARMREAQAFYAQIAASGGWQPLKIDGLLRRGDSSGQVADLVARLRFEYPELASDCNHEAKQNIVCEYSGNIVKAIEDFQSRHGLKVDGVVGPKTVRALNISAQQKRDKLALNIERISDFKSKLKDAFVLVNIPEYRLRFIEDGKVRASKDVVVGRPSWKTPSFSDKIEKFVVNPEWRIPLSIATREIAPKVAKDPEYLSKNNIVIRKNSFVDDELVDPATIDWDAIKPYDFDHFLVKLPNDKNPLGKVKYLFPNPHAVYVHDTPHQQWFDEPVRAASHGCIRLEDPFTLVKLIAEVQDGGALMNKVGTAREMQVPKTFHLNQPLPIHLVYWTAWADENGDINFRDDIYQRDASKLDTMSQVASL